MQLRAYQSDLVERVRKAWREGYRSPCIVLGCGGGKSCIVAEIARRTTENGKSVLFIVHRIELVDQIKKTFEEWGVDMSLCTIGMVQTITRHIGRVPPPALIITDENHHCLAESYMRIYKAFPHAYKVGVTATPVRLNGDGLGDVNDRLIEGVSTKWLIENRYLAPYEYFSPSVADLTGLRTSHGEFVSADIAKLLVKKGVFGDVISCYKKLASGKKAICYCATVDHSQRMAEAFAEAGISAAHIDGTTPAAQREQIISGFRSGEIMILCNVDLISEGFDVPDCECAILLRPTKSLTLYIQQSMRCMRYKEGKRAVIIDHVGNYARHGLPDEDRKWSLEKKPHGTREKADEKEKCRQCPECFFTFSIDEAKDKKVCPNCGYVFPNPREVKEEPGKLIKIESFKLALSGPEKCRSYEELLAYAKERGYKPGWAYYQAKAKGLI